MTPEEWLVQVRSLHGSCYAPTCLGCRLLGEIDRLTAALDQERDDRADEVAELREERRIYANSAGEEYSKVLRQRDDLLREIDRHKSCTSIDACSLRTDLRKIIDAWRAQTEEGKG